MIKLTFSYFINSFTSYTEYQTCWVTNPYFSYYTLNSFSHVTEKIVCDRLLFQSLDINWNSLLGRNIRNHLKHEPFKELEQSSRDRRCLILLMGFVSNKNTVNTAIALFSSFTFTNKRYNVLKTDMSCQFVSL